MTWAARDREVMEELRALVAQLPPGPAAAWGARQPESFARIRDRQNRRIAQMNYRLAEATLSRFIRELFGFVLRFLGWRSDAAPRSAPRGPQHVGWRFDLPPPFLADGSRIATRFILRRGPPVGSGIRSGFPCSWRSRLAMPRVEYNNLR